MRACRGPLLLIAGLLAVPAAPLLAQAGTDGAQFHGTWQGPYSSEGAEPGSLKLVIARENNAWKVTHDIYSNGVPPYGEVREFGVEGNTLSFLQTVGDLECKMVATLEANQLKGSAECSQGGVVAVTATFTLAKQ